MSDGEKAATDPWPLARGWAATQLALARGRL
jgi:hypothetical protein